MSSQVPLLEVSAKELEPTSVLPTFSVILNFIFGAGVLALPYAFANGGLLLSGISLILITIASIITMCFVLEVECRAEALENGEIPLPASKWKKREVSELCHRFMGMYGKRFFEFCIICYSLAAMWLYTSIFVVSLSRIFPLKNVDGGCPFDSQDPFDLPAGCHSTYIVYWAVYGVLMLSVVLLNLDEQKSIQMGLTGLGIGCLVVMIITVVQAMWVDPYTKTSSHRSHAPYFADVPIWDLEGFARAFTTFVLAQLSHHGVPGACQLVRPHSKARKGFVYALCATCIFYLLLGISCALYFGPANIDKVATLNWIDYRKSIAHTAVVSEIISKLICLFPLFTVSAAFPLYAVTLGETLFSSLPQRLQDYQRPILGLSLKKIFRWPIVILPLIGAFFISDVAAIVEVSGFFGFFIAFFVPCILQVKSWEVYSKRFGEGKVSFSIPFLSHPIAAKALFALAALAFGFAVYVTIK